MSLKKSVLAASFLLGLTPALTVLAATPDVVIYGTGNVRLGANGDKIYKINVGTGVSAIFAQLTNGDPAPNNDASPNSVAIDETRQLLFYSVDADGPSPSSAPSVLWSIPLNSSPPPSTVAATNQGTLNGNASGAMMYEGKYFYLDDGTNKWRIVTLSNSGAVVSDDVYCTAGDPGGYELGDIAGRQGIAYATVEKRSDNTIRFLKVDLSTRNNSGVCTTVYESASLGFPRQMQLAWGLDYTLYGYDPVTFLLYVVNPADGTRIGGPAYSSLVGMSDIDSLPPKSQVGIVKKTNNVDYDGDPTDTTLNPNGPIEIPVGDPVTWTYIVTNTGQLSLTNVTVTDDKIAPDNGNIECDTNVDGNIDGDDASNPSNVIPTLAIGESASCTATGTADAPGLYTNIGTVSATFVPLNNGDPVTTEDSDTGAYVGTEEPEENHDVALLVIDRDSIYDSSRCYKYKYGRCYKFRKDDPKDEEGDDDDDRKEPKYTKYGPPANLKAWSSADLGSSDFGKRSILPFFRDNVGQKVTLATGSIYKHSKYGSAEGWLAPACIPQKWLSASDGSDNTCMTGDYRQQGINNFFFMGGALPYAGPSSTIIQSSRLKHVPSVLPLRARGLKLLEGVKVCAVVYDDDVQVTYKKKDGKNYDYDKKNRDDDDDGKRRGERCGDKYDSDRYSSSHSGGDKYDGPLIRADLSGKTYGVVAFQVHQVIDRECKYCLPDVEVTILDPDPICSNLLLYNAPVPNGPKYPKDIRSDPLYDQTGYKKYRSLYYDNTQVPPELLF